MAEQTGTGTGTAAQGAGGGTTVVVGTPQGGGTTSTTAERRDASRTYAERLVARHGSEAKALDILAEENWEHREKIRTLTEANAQLTANQLPKDGVVLTGPEKAAWEAIKAESTKLGVALDKVAATITEAKTLKDDKAKTVLETSRSAAATDAKLNPLVLTPLLEQFGYDVESRTEKVANGTKVEDGKVVYIKKADDAKAAWEQLAPFIAKEGSPFKPFEAALKAVPANNGKPGTTTVTSQGGITRVVPDTTGTTPTNTGGGDDPISKRLKARNDQNAARGNPLMPAVAKPATP